MSWYIPGPGTLGSNAASTSGISLDMLDLGLWDLTLPPGLGHPGMSWGIPGHLVPGTLHCLHSWDILGCPRMSQQVLSGKGQSVAVPDHPVSVRHIIMRARRALMGPLSEVVLVHMYVCMSVRNGFMTELYKFTYSVYVPSGTCLSWCA